MVSGFIKFEKHTSGELFFVNTRKVCFLGVLAAQAGTSGQLFVLGGFLFARFQEYYGRVTFSLSLTAVKMGTIGQTFEFEALEQDINAGFPAIYETKIP